MPHGESNPRPSGLYRSVSTNCTTAYTTAEGAEIVLSLNQIDVHTLYITSSTQVVNVPSVSHSDQQDYARLQL